MSTRHIAAIAGLLFVLAACGGTPTATGPTSATAGPTGAPASQQASAAAPISFADLDVCALVGEAMAGTLTGESGFLTDQSSQTNMASCFWAVPRAGVPQYLEVQVSRRKSLADYNLNVNGVACTSAAVSGVGAEAKGGVCTSPQKKVWLIALQNGVSVQVIVNEPKVALTPADLAAAVNAVIAGLG